MADLQFEKFKNLAKLLGFELTDERLDLVIPPLKISIAAMEQLLDEDVAKEIEPTSFLTKIIERKAGTKR